MSKVISFLDSLPVGDLSLDEIVRQGANQMIQRVVLQELQQFLQSYEDNLTPDGKRAIVRNGYLPARKILTKAGSISVQIPKTRDRNGTGIKFNSALIPPYLKRSTDINAFIPWLYLKGISTGDMSETLYELLGSQATAITPDLIGRLKYQWLQEYKDWSKRTIGDEYVYIWADGIYAHVKADDAKSCMLVILGVRRDGVKELLAVSDGIRESSDSWYELLSDLQQRGLQAPKLAIADGAMGFWKALSQLYPSTKRQRCWFHKMGNVLNKVPKNMQGAFKSALYNIWQSPSRAMAERAYHSFVSTYQAKYPNAVGCLIKNINDMLTFYDFPATHWKSIRTSNPIESTFATIRQRTHRSKNCGSRETILSMMFKLALEAGKRYHRLAAYPLLDDVANGIRFIDGVKENTAA